MNVGFIGAGKVGFSMGKYMSERGIGVTGYYSRSPQSSLEAATFTNSRQYTDLCHLIEDSELILIAVPDGEISHVWEQLKTLPIQNKMIGHFSGSISSAVFSDITQYQAYGYSIHPFFAINNKYESYKELHRALITVEGDKTYLKLICDLFSMLGNRVETITADDKTRYHAAAVMVSNLYVGLEHLCEEMLVSCGFNIENARMALGNLLLGNAGNLANCGPIESLTGPIERNDISTVTHHLDVLTKEEERVYRILSLQTLKVAKAKHPDRDYSNLEEVLYR